MNQETTKFTGGPIRIFYVDKTTGLYKPIKTIPHNQVQFEGADIAAKVMSGDTSYRINTMYFEFTNTAGTGAANPTPTQSDNNAYFMALSGIRDFISAPIVINPTLSATSGDYKHNKVTFLGLIDDGVGESPAGSNLPFSAAAGSKVVSIGLAASPTGNLSENLVYGRVDIGGADGSTGIAKIDNHQIAYAWDVTFT